MEATATLRDLRMSPRKVRRIALPLRGMNVTRAEALLAHLPQAPARPLAKLLASCAANAESQGAGEKQTLLVKEVVVNEGRTLWRYRPRSRGMTHPIARRSSHVTMVLEGSGEGAKKQRRTAQEAQARAPRITPRPQPETKRIAPRLKAAGKRVFRRKSV